MSLRLAPNFTELERQLLCHSRPGGLWAEYREARAANNAPSAVMARIHRCARNRSKAWADGDGVEAYRLTLLLNGHADDIDGTPAKYAPKVRDAMDFLMPGSFGE